MNNLKKIGVLCMISYLLSMVLFLEFYSVWGWIPWSVFVVSLVALFYLRNKEDQKDHDRWIKAWNVPTSEINEGEKK